MEKLKKAAKFVKNNWRELATGTAVYLTIATIKKLSHDNATLKAERDLYRDIIMRSIDSTK